MSREGEKRGDTDRALREERARADAEFASSLSHAEHAADAVLRTARARADEVLRAERKRADSVAPLAETAAGRDVARTAEDVRVAEERTEADRVLAEERDERRRNLSTFLRLEREATDESMALERKVAEAAIASRDEFLGMVSHDLRNLIGSIALHASRIAMEERPRGVEPSRTLRSAHSIERASAQMKRLLGDLLDLVSLENGRLQVHVRPTDLDMLVRDAVEAFAPVFESSGIAFTTEVAAHLPSSELDEERILQVLANLLGNANKFTERGGGVILKLASEHDQLHFTVSDTGAGLPEGLEAEVFERFRQGCAKDRRGMGLGLYIAKSIVVAHGGRIWAERRPGRGTAFHFTLPVHGPAIPRPHE